jgi:hypothetical protein
MSKVASARHNITIREPRPASAAELAKRRELVAKTLKLREEIGPVRFSIARTIRAMREGAAEETGE